MGFFYSVTATIINSIWQSGLLVILYFIATAAAGNVHPLQKRNLLYGLLCAQVLMSVLTVFFYLNNPSAGYFSSLEVFSETGLFGRSSSYHPLIVFIYSAALIYKLTGIILKRKGFTARFISGRVRPVAELKIFTELKAYHFGIKRKVTLWYSHNIHTPLTFGFLKPVILLPVSLVNSISLRETEAIILHELAHIKSRDYLLNLFLVVTECIYFFNPFIKILTDKIKLEREKNCDIRVINFDYPELLYAEALLKTARSSKPVNIFHPRAVNKIPELLQRIRFFSEEKNRVFHRRIPGIPAAFCIIFFIATALFFLPGVKPVVRTVSSTLYTLPIAYEQAGPLLYDVLLTDEKTAPEKSDPEPEQFAEATTPEYPENEVREYEGAIFNNGFTAIPADYSTTPDSIKEFIYRIETQEGNFLQSFKLTWENGQWIMKPQWMMLETKPDSLRRNMLPAVAEPEQ